MKRTCPKCEGSWAWKLGDGRLKCRGCGKRYSAPASVWDSVRLSDAVKRELLSYFAMGVPSYRQRFESGASAKARERFYRLLRGLCAYIEDLREPLAGEIECDEAVFGGKLRGGPRGWTGRNKVVVFGLTKRNGEVKAFPLTHRDGPRILELIGEHTLPGSLYFTDAWKAYVSLRVRGTHVVVRKDREGRPRGRTHINGIEGFWSYAKHWMYQYRGVPRKYFHLYLAELCFRFNYRRKNLRKTLLKFATTISIDEIKPILVRSE